MRGVHAVIIAALLACALTTVVAETMDIKKAVEEGLIGSYSEKPADDAKEEDQEMQTGEAPKMRRDANDFGHRDVKVTAMIPDYLGKEIPVGDEVEMLVWFSNGAKTPLNVKGIFSALQSASDTTKFIQNVCNPAKNTPLHSFPCTLVTSDISGPRVHSSRRVWWTLLWRARARRRSRTSSARASTSRRCRTASSR